MRRHWMEHRDQWGVHSLSYVEWGPSDATRCVVCVHGLTRNARDFDDLAMYLADAGRRVIAVDVVGRGRSSWLADPAGYALPTYCNHIAALLDALGLRQVDWIGTSMGGLIAMAIANTGRLRTLVLNDIGPFVSHQALDFIRSYLRERPSFASLNELESYLRIIHVGFGRLSDAQWRRLAEHSSRFENGRFELRYDPAIGDTSFGSNAEISFWPQWQEVACPVLIVRGGESALLSESTVERMCAEHRACERVLVPDVGHAPTLMEPGLALRIDDFHNRH